MTHCIPKTQFILLDSKWYKHCNIASFSVLQVATVSVIFGVSHPLPLLTVGLSSCCDVCCNFNKIQREEDQGQKSSSVERDGV